MTVRLYGPGQSVCMAQESPFMWPRIVHLYGPGHQAPYQIFTFPAELWCRDNICVVIELPVNVSLLGHHKVTSVLQYIHVVALSHW